MKLRVCVLATTYFPLMNGHVRLIHNHASGLAKNGNEVLLVTPMRWSSRSQETVDGVRVLRPSFPEPRNRFAVVFRFIALVDGLNALRRSGRVFDTAYCLGIIPAAAAILMRPLMRYNVAMGLDDLTSMRSQRRLSHKVYRTIAVILVNLSNVTIFPTFFARGFVLGSQTAGRGKTAVVPAGTDLGFFTKEKGATVQKGLVLYAGGIRARKGLDTLIRSMKQVSDRLPYARLALVGGGDGRFALEKLISELGMSDRVTMPGRVSEAELKEYHSHANVYVMPSQFDAYATSLIEAMAMEEPVISTRGSAPEEIIRNGENGILVRYGDVEELTRAVEKLIQDDRNARAIGIEARKTVEEDYDLKKCVTSLERAFSSHQ